MMWVLDGYLIQARVWFGDDELSPFHSCHLGRMAVLDGYLMGRARASSFGSSMIWMEYSA